MNCEVLPEVYFFDMDHTLIANDCDISWKIFLNEEKLIEAGQLAIAEKFYEDYCREELNEAEFIRFQLREFVGCSEQEMNLLARRHFDSQVKHTLIASVFAELTAALQQKAHVALLTATNSVVARPLADFCGIEHVLATAPELDAAGSFTGAINGDYCCGRKKIKFAEEFCRARGLTLSSAAYYGDSLNDRHLLERVGFPVAVNPTGELLEIARANSWRIITSGRFD